MVRTDFPDIDTQTDLYTRILDQADGKEVVFRTLDIGGDKVLPYFQSSDEENPAMGWRAIRIAMDRPGMLRTQLRALIRAAAGRPLSVMFPMVADLSEFEFARRLLMKEIDRSAARAHPTPSQLKVGVMLEVPSLAFQIAGMAGRADFISIGSNDLLQFLFAADRGNPRLDGRYDPLSPPALGFMAHIVRECEQAGIPLSVCGEMAGDPLQAMALIGLGLRRLSMAPGAIGPVRTMVRSLDVTTMREFMQSLLHARGHSQRAQLAGYARDHNIKL
jgi:phosphotransferase system enzyme I (PtsP)